MNNNFFSKRQKSKIYESKIGKILFITGFLLLAVFLGLVIRPWVTEKPASAKDNETSYAYQKPETSIDETLKMVEQENKPLIENNNQDDKTSEQNLFAQKSNGIEITTKNFRRESGYVLVDICLEMPDNSDWMLDHFGTWLEFGEEKVILQGFTNIEYNPFESEGNLGNRCDTAKFEVPSQTNANEFILRITQLSAPPREGSECQFYLNRVQRELDNRNAGIKIGCTNDGNGIGVTIEEKPAEMSISEAEAIVLNPEFYTFPGDWKFSFNLEQ